MSFMHLSSNNATNSEEHSSGLGILKGSLKSATLTLELLSVNPYILSDYVSVLVFFFLMKNGNGNE